MKAAVATVVLALATLGATQPAAQPVAQPAAEGGGSADGRECARHAAGASGARVRPGADVRDIGSPTRAQQRVLELRLRAAPTQPRGGPITVPVRVHVILRDNGTGGVSNTEVADQISVINRAFAGATAPAGADSPFTFVLRSVDRTRNSDWYQWTLDDDDVPAKRALHQGGATTLNVYVTGLRQRQLGYAFLPVPQPLFRDGVVLLNQTLPGGTAAPYNRGDTATHEIGHWLALYHTFEGGCLDPGDRVRDTPKQANGESVYLCNESLNTCPAPGRDPVHNFMSYGNDLCLNLFTAGQVTRMARAWETLRAP